MHRTVSGILLGAAVAAAAAPAAARDRMGVMKSFHGAHRVIVLDDGTQYRVANDASVPIFRAGDKVWLETERRGDHDVITRMSIAE